MKKILSLVVAGAMAMGTIAVVGVSAASAATLTPTTVKLTDPKAVLNNGAYNIVATTSVAGTVQFTAGGAPIAGCEAVATGTVTPFLATCSWTPAAAGAITLGATFVPTDTTDYLASGAPAIAEVVATPVQGSPVAPITLYVDTILASGSSGVLAPKFGTGCEITSEFIVGQTIVFRMFGNDSQLGGAALNNQNVSSATITIGGVSTPLTMSYGNHSGVAFWTAPLATGTAAGQYNTLGVMSYTVTVKTIAIPAVTKKVQAFKTVTTKVNGVSVSHRVSYLKTVIVTPAVPGATGTFTPNFTSSSVVTLNAVPTVTRYI